MPALSAFADVLDKAAALLVDPAITSDELCKRGLPGQNGEEKKLLTRTRDQVVKRFGPSNDVRERRDIPSEDFPTATAQTFVGGKEGRSIPTSGARGMLAGICDRKAERGPETPAAAEARGRCSSPRAEAAWITGDHNGGGR